MSKDVTGLAVALDREPPAPKPTNPPLTSRPPAAATTPPATP